MMMVLRQLLELYVGLIPAFAANGIEAITAAKTAKVACFYRFPLLERCYSCYYIF
jgi:hypothetical protein